MNPATASFWELQEASAEGRRCWTGMIAACLLLSVQGTNNAFDDKMQHALSPGGFQSPGKEGSRRMLGGFCVKR